ncbi:MAG TPA: class I SAM-dependent methyltransferase [Candidatus Nanoarchaeia archaeon]|nr:class I SAM-dependent methyltransferase [Candidatus Nanoarchaeia archaeon]
MDYTKMKLNKILKLMPRGKGLKVIDIGCHFGEVTSFLHHRGYNVLGIDIDPKAISIAKRRHKNTKFKAIDVYRIDFSRYDIIIAWGLFEYVYDLRKLMLKLEKEMRPGATIIFSVPNVCSFSKRIKCLFGFNPNRDKTAVSYSFTFKQIGKLIMPLKFEKKEITYIPADCMRNICFPMPRNFSVEIIVKMIK